MIARNELPTDIVKQIDSEVHYLNESDMNYPNPYEYSLWCDDIMVARSYNHLIGYHFYNQPLCEGIDPKKINITVDPLYNVVHTVLESIKTLVYKSPFPWHFDGKFEKSLMIRFLIHMVGDMHQPLHVITRCTPEKPSCDQGGNLFPIQGVEMKNLHALWDSAMLKIPYEQRVFSISE